MSDDHVRLIVQIHEAVKEKRREGLADLLDMLVETFGDPDDEPPDREDAVLQILLAAEKDPKTAAHVVIRKARKLLADPLKAAGFTVGGLPFGEPMPEPVIWQDTGHRRDFRDPLLPVGEVAVFSGAGNSGKSTVLLSLIHQAGYSEGGAACGLKIAPGPVVLANYEDALNVQAVRAGWYGQKHEWSHLVTVTDPLPLFRTEDKVTRPTAYWDRFWRAVRAVRPVLVVLDPAGVLMADTSMSDATAVRSFILHTTREAGEAECGVLIVAHDTKGARSEIRAGETPGAGVIAGSGQWYDASRGVLHMANYPGVGRVIVAAKSNYARTGWGAKLRERYNVEGRWQGYELDERWNDAAREIKAAKK